MDAFSVWHWIVVALIVVLLFGRGKVPELMADLAKGVKSFRKNLSDDEAPPIASDKSPGAD